MEPCIILKVTKTYLYQYKQNKNDNNDDNKIDNSDEAGRWRYFLWRYYRCRDTRDALAGWYRYYSLMLLSP